MMMRIGETPPPLPIDFWHWQTAVEGVDIGTDDYNRGRVSLKEGAKSGFLRGRMPPTKLGRWMAYAVLYAAPGGDKNDFVKVVFNGNAGLKFQNDQKSGYPCVGIKCLSGTGTYSAEATVQDDVVMYELTWTSSSNLMWLGAGQATFSGVMSLSPPIPAGAPIETLVTAINCIDGKTLGVDVVCSDGPLATGFTMASEVRLTVLLGDAAGWEGSLSKGELKVKVAAPPAGQRYRCVGTNTGMMEFYTSSVTWASHLHSKSLSIPC